jgi:hypothetical protein
MIIHTCMCVCHNINRKVVRYDMIHGRLAHIFDWKRRKIRTIYNNQQLLTKIEIRRKMFAR